MRISLLALGTVAFAVVGLAAVWQGFGLAGYGTDIHVRRVFVVVALLFAAGMPLVWPKMWLPGRVLAAILGLVAASWAWWEVPTSTFRSAMSLREAVEERDRYRELLATATVEDIDRSEGLRGIDILADQFPSLGRGLSADYGAWNDRMWIDIRSRYERTPPDDVKTVLALRAATRRLAEVHPAAGESLKETDHEWVSRAVSLKVAELVKAHGDWAAFSGTAPGRKALTEAFPKTAPDLVKAEETWVNESVEVQIELALATSGAKGVRASVWRAIERDVLALQSLDTGEERFRSARQRLFDLGHASAWHETNQHLKAGRYNRAFGLARAHAVEWNATATLLGRGEVEKLDLLREKCAALVKPGVPDPGDVDEPETLPPPRTKPEK